MVIKMGKQRIDLDRKKEFIIKQYNSGDTPLRYSDFVR
jgi:hypothetical protein